MRSGHFVKFFGARWRRCNSSSSLLSNKKKKIEAEVLKFCFLRVEHELLFWLFALLCFGGLDVRKKKVEPKGLSRTLRPSATS